MEEVDEREIFGGSENKLTMRQTYTHNFQCMYLLANYPFDTQVIFWIVLIGHAFQLLGVLNPHGGEGLGKIQHRLEAKKFGDGAGS